MSASIAAFEPEIRQWRYPVYTYHYRPEKARSELYRAHQLHQPGAGAEKRGGKGADQKNQGTPTEKPSMSAQARPTTPSCRISSVPRIDLDILTVPGSKSTSEIITDVANRKIAYTVTDRNIADAHRSLYPDSRFRNRVEPKPSARMGRPEAIRRAAESAEPVVRRESTQTYVKVLQDKYYRQQHLQKRAMHAFYSGKAGEISDYDPSLGQKICSKHQVGLAAAGFAALRRVAFRSSGRLLGRAMGLMQLMPATARMFGMSEVLQWC